MAAGCSYLYAVSVEGKEELDVQLRMRTIEKEKKEKES